MEAMTIKDILVHVDDGAPARARLDLALKLAQPFGARVTALYLLAEPFMSGASRHAPADVIHEHLALANAAADKVLAVMAADAERSGAGFRILKESGSLDRLPGLLARDARNSDLVIVGQPDPKTGSSDDALLVEAAFMETGRPALVIPYGGAPQTPFDRVMVAWNASREASRAVHDALPLLVAAKEVVILVIDPDDIAAALGRQPGSGVARHLEHHGASVRVKTVESGRRRAGEVILSEATAETADLLVMGGYGHSKLREALLGGATRTLLADATLPILLSH
jgi:nucleotide-binding universal stress UspA family protein